MLKLRRPLRSVFLGDLRYHSHWRFGVAQAIYRMGGVHRAVEITGDLAMIDKQVSETAPDVIWAHMLMWPPHGPHGVTDAEGLLTLCEKWRKAGAKVLLHDGDPRPHARYPYDVSRAVDLVLCNHKLDRSVWGVPQMFWPFGCFAMGRPAERTEDLRATLAFTGTLQTGGLYDERTTCLKALDDLGVLSVFPGDSESVNTFLRTPELATSAEAVIGFGRPDIGWIDTRVFQYPGAGGVLLHDDVAEDFTGMEDGVHYVKVDRYSVDSILRGLEKAKKMGPVIRANAFAYMQRFHTWDQRVRQALARL